jgi:O-methyltransferase
MDLADVTKGPPKTLLHRTKDTVEGAFNVALRPFGLSVNIRRATSQAETIDPLALSWKCKPGEFVATYNRAIEQADGGWSDNFYKQCRHFNLWQMLEWSLERTKEKADVAECGCWKGQSTFEMASLLDNRGFSGEFDVFDAFEGGLSHLTPHDVNERGALSSSEAARQSHVFVSREEEVSKLLTPFSFVRLFKGWIPDRFNEISDKRFFFVHIDVDLFEPTRDSLNFFFPRLVDGGVIVLDDYGYSQFPGAKQAVDELLHAHDVTFFCALPTGGAFLIK